MLLICLCCLFLFAPVSCAVSERKVGRISASVFADGEWKPTYNAYGYLHPSEDIYGDGLAFGNVKSLVLNPEYADKVDIPEYTLEDDFSFKVVAEKPYDGVWIEFHIYAENDGKLSELEYTFEPETPEEGTCLIKEWPEMEDGRYLIEAPYGIYQDEFYERGSKLFWLRIDENSESSQRPASP